MTSFFDRLNSQLKGVDAGIVIYWDETDPSNPGPAYRDAAAEINGSGELRLQGWSGGDASGYSLDHYFGPDGKYLGPDQHGVYPVLVG